MKINKKYTFIIMAIMILVVGLASVSANDTKNTSISSQKSEIQTSNQEYDIQAHQSNIQKIKDTTKTTNKTKGATKSVTVKTYRQLVNTLENDYDVDVVNFERGTYKITESIALQRDVTINGNNSVLDGQGRYSFLFIHSGNNVKINDLTIQNTKGTNRGAGAVINSESCTSTIKNCKFNNNYGIADRGGAITNRGTLTIIASTFTNNTDIKSGAIYSNGPSINIYNSTFTRNVASSNGNDDKTAVLYLAGEDRIVLSGNTFNNNKVRAIHSYKNKNILINNTKFINSAMSTRIDIRGSVLDNYETPMTLANCTFNNINTTTAKKNNGIIYHEAGALNMLNNNFTNINSKSTQPITQGGIIFIRNSTSKLEDNLFANKVNSGNTRGGAIYLNLAKVTVTNNIFNTRVTGKTTYGGAIYVDPQATLIEGANLFNNTVTGSDIKSKTIFSWGKVNHINVKSNLEIRTASASVIVGNKVTLTANVTSKGQLVNDGKVIFKVNGVTLKDSKNNEIASTVRNGKASITYTTPISWSKESYKFIAKFVNSSKYNDRESQSETLTMKKRTAKITLTLTPNSGAMDDVITLTARINDNMTVNTGLVIFKFNGETIKYSNGTQVRVNIKNNVATYKFTLPHGISARNYTFTTVYSNIRYNRMETQAILGGVKANVKVKLDNATTNNNVAYLTGKLTDVKGHSVTGSTYCAIKVGNTVIKNSQGNAQYFEVKNGDVKISFRIPDEVLSGSYVLTLIGNERNSYNNARGTSTIIVTK